MYLKKIIIHNFRGIKNGVIDFQEGTNIIIGPSNIGKTSVVKAIEFLLCPRKQWWKRDILSEYDFNNKNCNENIVIEGIIGCSKKACIDDGSICPRFEIETEGKSETCKLTNYVVAMNIKDGNILKMEQMSGEIEYELVLRLKMIASFNKTDGYVATKHFIINEKGEEWVNFSKDMKAWIGIELLDSGRNNEEFKLKYNSLLSKFAGNIDEWQYQFLKKFKASLQGDINIFSEDYLAELLSQVNKNVSNIFPALSGELNISIEGANKNELIRQIGLSCKLDNGEDLPFSYQGKGFQNILSILLSTRLMNIVEKNFPSKSIILLEEPEQNLEPQLQGSILETLKNIVEAKENKKQFIITTHSPHILSNNTVLSGIVKLEKDSDDKLISLNMETIKTAGGKYFADVRNFAHTDIELFESLFSSVVIIWEGDSDIGFYTGLIKCMKYPSELLYGICGEGSSIHMLAEWFQTANYKTIVILDGDNENIIDKLCERNISFMALPRDKNLEHIIARELIKLPDSKLYKVLLSVVGLRGEVNSYPDYESKWPALYKIFEEENATRSKISMELANKRIETIARENRIRCSPEDENKIGWILGKYKNRRELEELARLMIEENCVPDISKEILRYLREIWLRKMEPPILQFL